MAIDLKRIMQGERGTLTITWQFPDSLTSPASIAGAAITAIMQNLDTAEVTTVSGPITGTAATTATWALSEGDSAVDGVHLVIFRAVVAGVATYTLAASLTIDKNPAVDAVQNPALVGVTMEQAVWLSGLPVVAGYLMQRTAVPTGESVTIPDGYQMLVFGDFIVDGDLIAIGDLVIL